jgi:5'-methylthioadenosine phosphorylase
MNPTIAVIGGTGVYDPAMLQQVSSVSIDTPYGEVSCQTGIFAGTEVAFIPRHGKKHSIPPHLINYRANIWALKSLGVRKIIATTAVGSLNPLLKPGDFVLADQLLDYTKSRVSTFYEGNDRGVVHVDFTYPFCGDMRRQVGLFADELQLPVHDGGCYVCTEGPRFETAAEVKAYRLLGGDIVGMTGVPEAVLAREAEMCYITVSMVTNFAAGISKELLTHREVYETMNHNSENIKKLIARAIESLDPFTDCDCQHALQEFGGFKL